MLVTNGGKQAVANVLVLCDPGDEVLVPAPYWTTYPEAIALAGGTPVSCLTDEANGFRVTVEELEAAGPRDQGAALRLAVEPHRGRLPARRDRGHRHAGPLEHEDLGV